MKIVSKPPSRAHRRREEAQPQPRSDEIERLADDALDIGAREATLENIRLGTDLEENLRIFELIVGPAPDIALRRMRAELPDGHVDVAILHIYGIINREQTERIMNSVAMVRAASRSDVLHRLQFDRLTCSAVRSVNAFGDMWNAMTTGAVVILADGHDTALACSSQAYKSRQIEEPPTDSTLRGPRQGFVESLPDNLALLRQWIASPNLWIEQISIGHLSHTQVAMVYIKGLASEELLTEVRQRVQRIRTDTLFGSGPLMELIQDEYLTVVPLALSTERPDRVVGNIVEGRVALLVQNSPFALVVPFDYGMMFQAADDYYDFVPLVTLTTALRVAAFWTMILLPGAFTAALTFHQELLPTPLLLRIVADRSGVPFSVALEVFMMELLFELLREAGLRLPRAVGSAVTIVGALILGEAAINAGIVSPSVIIVVAVTAICSFVLPTFSYSIPSRLLRFVFIALGGALGLLGMELGLVALIAYMASHRSFGHPFMTPVAPVTPGRARDFVFRQWKWGGSMRPLLVGGREPQRQAGAQVPGQGSDPESVGTQPWGKNGRSRG